MSNPWDYLANRYTACSVPQNSVACEQKLNINQSGSPQYLLDDCGVTSEAQNHTLS